jgi:hypothetical protein
MIFHHHEIIKIQDHNIVALSHTNTMKTHRSLYEKNARKLLTGGRRYMTGTSTVMMIVRPFHGFVTSNWTSFAKGYEGIWGGAS